MIRWICLLLALLMVEIPAAQPVEVFGAVTVSDPGLSGRLRARFKANGMPVFLLSDPSRGLAQGDLIRFTDRAILIDADVWQTLQSEGALEAIRRMGGEVVQVRARAREASWKERRALVKSARDRKMYALGETLLRALEEIGSPKGLNGQVELSFENGNLLLMASRRFLEGVRESAPTVVVRGNKSASSYPYVVGAPPNRVLAEQPFHWRPWVLDSTGGSSAEMGLEFVGNPPEGLVWDRQEHSLQGRMAPGTYLLSLAVTAPGQPPDTLHWHVKSRRNHAPRVHGTPGTAWEGATWSFVPAFSDSDHGGEDLSVVLDSCPPGMIWSDSLAGLVWTPPIQGMHRVERVRLHVVDAAGASTEASFEIAVRPRDPRFTTSGIRATPPWDTLVVGREFRWNAKAAMTDWASQGLTLRRVWGNASTEWDGLVVVVVPRSVGVHRLHFVLHAPGNDSTRDVVLEFPVVDDRAPVWTSTFPVGPVPPGESRTYRPLALDPEGDSVDISCAEAPGISWSGSILRFEADEPGWLRTTCRAADRHGRVSTQEVAVEVADPVRRDFYLQYSRYATADPWRLALESGRGRVGLQVIDVERTFGWRRWIRQDWPMIFVGVDLLGSRDPRSRLWFDLGGVVRYPDKRIVTGGVMARLEGSFRPVQGLPWRVDLELHNWVQQGLLLVDTSGLRLATTGSRAASGPDRETRNQWEWKVEQALTDAPTARNAMMVSHLEGWWELHPHLETGPGIWREDRMVNSSYRQYIGWGIRSRWNWHRWQVQPSVRGGWGSGEASWGVWGDLKIGAW